MLSATDLGRPLGGVALEVALYAVFGIAVGCLIRNQIAAIVGFVVYLFVVGPILSGVPATSDVAQYLPYRAGNALGRLTSSVSAAMLGQAVGGLVLLAGALAYAALGIRVAIRRDITQRNWYARPTRTNQTPIGQRHPETSSSIDRQPQRLVEMT